MSPLNEDPLLKVLNLGKYYGEIAGCRDISLSVWPGEVLESSADLDPEKPRF